MTDGKPLAVGIDLGTTYSCIAYIDEYDRPTVAPNSENSLTTPSVVLFEEGTRVVGLEAKNMSKAFPDNVVELIKREMGKSDSRFMFDGQQYRPEEISSYILKKVVQDAEAALARPIEKVVITCPAYFGIAQKEATENAGKIAGLDVLAIVHEPVAAAIAWRASRADESDRNVLVYDLGGGTFDVTYINFSSDSPRVIATGGNDELGGRNWDEVIVGYLANQWQLEHGADKDPTEDPQVLNDLFLQAESTKKAITVKGKGRTTINYLGQGTNVTLDREMFDKLTSSLLERTINYTNDLMRDVKEYKKYPDPDIILMVGGSTYMPQIAERIEREYGVTPVQYDPDQAVAKGAAIFARRLLEIPGPQPDPMPIQATSRSFGVIALESENGELVEKVMNLIKKYDPLPASATQTFGTVQANQLSADIHFMENFSLDDRTEVKTSTEIGTAVLGLPSGLPAGAGIEITFQLDESGLLRATAREVSENRTIHAEIKTVDGMTPEEIQHAQEDRRGLVVN